MSAWSGSAIYSHLDRGNGSETKRKKRTKMNRLRMKRKRIDEQGLVLAPRKKDDRRRQTRLSPDPVTKDP